MQKSKSSIRSFQSATGKIRYTLKNDVMFHIVMTRSKPALKSLICALMKLDEGAVTSVVVTNPIDYRSYNGKEVVLDVSVILNNSKVLDIELQTYIDKDWKERSLLYLCRSFDNISKGEDYELIKPTTFIALMDYDLFPEYPEFYSHFQLLNLKYHYPYSSKFNLNVLSLHRTELAGKDEKHIVRWAKIFQATTWEELKALSQNDSVIQEVGEVMYDSSIYQSEEQTIMEGHERFLAMKRARYRNGYDAAKEEYEQKLQKIVADNSEKDARIAELEAQLAALQK